MRKHFELIVAMDENNVIGRKDTNDIPWHCPGDLDYFRAVTIGRTIVMGTKTWASLPRRPLTNRRNVVISRQDSSIPGADGQYSSLEQALDHESEPLIIGGAQLYEAALLLKPAILHITIIHVKSDGDVLFPVKADLAAGCDAFTHGGAIYRRVHYRHYHRSEPRHTVTRWQRVDED